MTTVTTFTLRARHTAGSEAAELAVDPDRLLKIGRLPQNDFAIAWDRTVSREHATIEWTEVGLQVRCLPAASNPIVFQSQFLREAVIRPGQSFLIGATVFELLDRAPAAGSARPAPAIEKDLEGETLENSGTDTADDLDQVEEFAYGEADLKSTEFENTGRQMEILAQLPQLISDSQSDLGLAEVLADLLLDAIPQSIAVAVAQYDRSAVEFISASESSILSRESILRQLKPKLMRVRTRETYQGRFMPSRRLVSQALLTSKCAMHIWGGGEQEGGGFTMSDDLGWAFCVPIPGIAGKGWCLYVSGKGGKDGSILVTGDDFKADLRFTQLLTQFLGSVWQVRKLKEQTTQLSSFFSPKVVENLTSGSDADILTPSERDITVMFCDVRGFSRKSEQSHDNLKYLLSCVKEALAAMTNGILKYDGAIADFQGDAALGFWGWPSAIKEGAVPACLAALAVQAQFANAGDNELLEGFSVGVGIAHGRAIAGQIGTAQQAKIGVFGPVVNQGSRLEGMTRQFGVQICLDEASAGFARDHFSADQARVRRLARVRPKGMDTPINVYELLPPESAACQVTAGQITAFDAALDLIIAGQWAEAIALLNELPDDGPRAFLLKQMARSNNHPPEDWDGAFSLSEK